MEKIIFFILVVPIMFFVLYLGGSAIMKGFKAKGENRDDNSGEELTEITSNNKVDLSSEIAKLNDLYQNGVLTKDEFEKAKDKLLNN